jgi:hypothetical protein
MTAESRTHFEDLIPRTLPAHHALPGETVFKLPACVHLHGEWVAIVPTEQGINKYSIRVEERGGLLRSLTKDEELALAIAPATSVERTAAADRLRIPDGELRLVLFPEPWHRGDLEIVVMQLERCPTA